MRLIGTVLLAGGILLVALVLGFVVAMVVAVTLGSLIPVDPESVDATPEILRAVLVYLVWGITATAVFALTWRRLRSSAPPPP
jgi:multisubunit Na+/H+ antiporter MnhE subunit